MYGNVFLRNTTYRAVHHMWCAYFLEYTKYGVISEFTSVFLHATIIGRGDPRLR